MSVRLSSAAEANPGAGLIVIWVEASVQGAAMLSFSRDGKKVSSIPIAPGSQWVAAHSHLLPNGPNRISWDAEQGSRSIASGGIVLQVDNQGPLAEAVAASMRRHGTPLMVSGALDSTLYDYADSSLTPWHERPDAKAHIDTLVASGRASAAEGESLRQFLRDGFLIMEDAIPADLIAQANREIDDAVRRKVEGYEWGSSQRIHNLHDSYAGIRRLWLYPPVMRRLELIFGAPPRPCQTLTYVFGSQQDAHQDTIHLTPFPAGHMCGVWMALEDVKPHSGELEVYPGTHRTPRVYMNTVGCEKVTGGDWREFGAKVVSRWGEYVNASGRPKMVYRPRAGTVLIWHENLIHAGSIRIDKSLSRRSIVTHNFAEGSVAYYDSSGSPGSSFSLAHVKRELP
jgi:hypothetical protein